MNNNFCAESSCNIGQYFDFFNDSDDVIITLPLIDIYDPSEHLFYIVENKLKSKQNITIIVSGNDYTNRYEENYVNNLIDLKKNIAIYVFFKSRNLYLT